MDPPGGSIWHPYLHPLTDATHLHHLFALAQDTDAGTLCRRVLAHVDLLAVDGVYRLSLDGCGRQQGRQQQRTEADLHIHNPPPRARWLTTARNPSR